MTQNSAPTEIIRPEELMEELGIKKDAYYKDINYLDIKPEKDSDGKVYLTNEQADRLRALRNHVNETGKREGIELSLPSDRSIREVMEAEAQKQGLQISKSRLAELQPLAGRNPMLARKIIRNEKLGLKQDRPEHTQYVVIMPVIIAMLFSFAVVRFIGMGTGNKGLYITGGICLVSAMALKQLGNVRGARKRLGQ